jgi:hypothetical protein
MIAWHDARTTRLLGEALKLVDVGEQFVRRLLMMVVMKYHINDGLFVWRLVTMMKKSVLRLSIAHMSRVALARSNQSNKFHQRFNFFVKRTQNIQNEGALQANSRLKVAIANRFIQG